MIAEGLKPWFAGLAPDQVRGDAVDLDQLPALSEERERLWAQLSAASFLTVNEKREAIGLDALDLGEGEAGDDEVDDDPENSEGEDVSSDDADPVEAKFNPWHDPDNGQFTFAGSGVNYENSDGADSDSFSASANMSTRPQLPEGAIPTSDGRFILNRATVSYEVNGLNGKGYKPKPEDRTLLARLIYAESLSNPEDFEAIGWSVVNRVGERQHGKTLDSVIRRPMQYEVLEVGGGPKGNTSQWNETGDPDKLTGVKRTRWGQALAAADGILNGKIPDPTGGATFFLNSTVYERGKKKTGRRFFDKNLESGRFVDSPYKTRSRRKHTNHFFVEVTSKPKPKPSTSNPKRRISK